MRASERRPHLASHPHEATAKETAVASANETFMQPSLTTFAQLHQALREPLAVRVGGEVFPVRWPEPPLRAVIEQGRDSPKARIATAEP